jgi:DNA-binding beta-propeller fold protein YncE
VQTSAVNVRDYAFVGDNPIGMAHTSYGRFTYVNDAHGDAVYKIDNASNTVVGDRSAPRRRYASRAGQDGPSWRTSASRRM